jgi:hypothetical protein
MIVSVASTLFIAASTNNYLGFYPGIEQVTANISTITLISQTSLNASSILANAIADNPSGYSGFRVSLFLTAYFLPSNMSNSLLFYRRPLSSSSIGWTSVTPHSRVGVNMTARLDSEDTATISRYLALNSDNVTVHTTLEVYVSTFLDSALGAILANPNGTVQEVPLIVT